MSATKTTYRIHTSTPAGEPLTPVAEAGCWLEAGGHAIGLPRYALSGADAARWAVRGARNRFLGAVARQGSQGKRVAWDARVWGQERDEQALEALGTPEALGASLCGQALRGELVLEAEAAGDAFDQLVEALRDPEALLQVARGISSLGYQPDAGGGRLELAWHVARLAKCSATSA